VVAHEAVMGRGASTASSSVLVTGVASGVGVAALLIAKHLGAKVIGTSGSSSKLAKLRPHGLDVGIETRNPDFSQSVLDATGERGVDVVVDNVGGAFLNENVASLAPGGRLAAVGRMGGLIKPPFDLDRFNEKRIVMFGLSYRLRTAGQKAAALRDFVVDLGSAFAGGRIVPLIDREFDFEDVAAAHSHLASDTHVGKIVLRVSRD
jgi:NADPH:quinone reductase-like Zn-dependent oxidoreductase